jgi:hypothetical protein
VVVSAITAPTRPGKEGGGVAQAMLG